MSTTEAAPRTRTRRPASRRGVLIYAVGVLVLSMLGGLVMAASPDPETSPGALLFVLSPILMAVGLRTLGREGWADAGLRLGRERGWYAVALLLFPVLFPSRSCSARSSATCTWRPAQASGSPCCSPPGWSPA